MFVGIIGSGSWGVALAQVLTDNNVKNIVWGRSEDEVNNINEKHQLRYFPDVILNKNIKATSNFNDLKECDILLIATPTVALESIIEKINETIEQEVIIINVSKGFYADQGERISTAISRLINPELLRAVVSLVGPTHAEEVILGLETAIVSVSDDLESAKVVQNIFSNDYFRVYTSDDVIGAEIGAAIKNVIAIASGIINGSGLGDNAQAALITRGLTEISRLGMAMGGKIDTFLGLTGVGDLIVTATSVHSRNYQAGLEIGSKGAQYFWDNNDKTVEGARAVVQVVKLAEHYDVSMPISKAVYDILYNEANVKEKIKELMTRELKNESIHKND